MKMKKFFILTTIFLSLALICPAEVPLGQELGDDESLDWSSPQMMGDKPEMKDLNAQEAGEIAPIQASMREINQKYLEKMKGSSPEENHQFIQKLRDEIRGFEDKLKAVREKFRALKYKIMEKLKPGASALFIKFDQEVGKLKAELKKKLDEHEAEEKAEEAKEHGRTKEMIAKFETKVKAIHDAFKAKVKELRDKIFAPAQPETPEKH